MTEGSSSSIFDEASRQSKKGFLKKKPEGSKLPTAPPKPENVPSDDEVKSMFQKMREMKEKLNTQIHEVFEKSGENREELESFVVNPIGLPPETQEQIDAQFTQIENKVKSVLGNQAIKGRKQIKEEKEESKRKKKFIGKRRNWMQM